VDGHEQGGGARSPPDAVLSPAVPVDLDIKKIGQRHRRQPQEHREAAQGHGRIVGDTRPAREGEVIERRMDVGGGAGHDLHGRMRGHAPREGLVGGQLLEAETIEAEGGPEDEGERQPEHVTSLRSPGGHGPRDCRSRS
jgi:hypothetical protein